MFFIGLVYFIILALILTAIFSYGFNIRGPWGSFWAFFAIIFLAVWAADIWITPFGPYYNEVYWLPPLIVGVLIAILLAAATPTRRSRRTTDTHPPATEYETDAVAATLGILFWILLALFIISIVIGLVTIW